MRRSPIQPNPMLQEHPLRTDFPLPCAADSERITDALRERDNAVERFGRLPDVEFSDPMYYLAVSNVLNLSRDALMMAIDLHTAKAVEEALRVDRQRRHWQHAQRRQQER